MTAPPSNLNALVSALGLIADYCDRIDHNEATDVTQVQRAAEEIRALGAIQATLRRATLGSVWADRIEEFEAAHPALGVSDVPSQIRRAATWHELQAAQYEHDRIYHPDILGLPKREQLLHSLIHLVKSAADLAREDTAGRSVTGLKAQRRGIDCVIFSVKIATLCGQRLPGTAPEVPSPSDQAARPSRPDS